MGEAIVDAAAILGGLTVIGGISWRYFIAPAFTRTVREIVNAENASALKPIIDELSFNSGKSMKDVLIRVDARLDDHIMFHRRSEQ